MKLDLAQTARLLLENDDFLILTHAHPDADTLGSGFALCRVLTAAGKRARVVCGDEIGAEYSFMYDGLPDADFEPRFIVAVDVADTRLLGARNEALYADRVELCIDHHASNILYARQTLLDPTAAATAEIIFDLLPLLGQSADTGIAECIFAGISTDTGCFRYSNTTAKTHRVAAAMMDAGASSAKINRIFFETKKKGFIELEKLALNSLRLYLDDRCAVIVIMDEMLRRTGCTDNDCDLISAIPRQVEGVLVGTTIREQPDGSFKLSVRTHEPISAAEICKKLGGGGHAGAAGCRSSKPLDEILDEFLACVKPELDRVREQQN